MKQDKTFLRRIEGGPSREELFDALRLGHEIPYFDEFLWGRLYKQRLKNVSLLEVGRVYENDHHTWRIKCEPPGHSRPIEAFYSTNTRSGYICRAEEIASLIFPGCVVPAYRPLTDYQIMGLLQLASISRHPRLLGHIKIRLLRGIEGIEYVSGKGLFAHTKHDQLMNLFNKVWESPKNKSVVARFREILG
jgi:hypothetical protein